MPSRVETKLPTSRIVKGNAQAILNAAALDYPNTGVVILFNNPGGNKRAANFRHNCYKVRKAEQDKNTRVLPGTGVVAPGRTVWDNLKLIRGSVEYEGEVYTYLWCYDVMQLEDIDIVFCPRTGQIIDWK